MGSYGNKYGPLHMLTISSGKCEVYLKKKKKKAEILFKTQEHMNRDMAIYKETRLEVQKHLNCLIVPP